MSALLLRGWLGCGCALTTLGWFVAAPANFALAAPRVVALSPTWGETDNYNGTGVQTLSDMSPSGFTAYHSGPVTAGPEQPRVYQEFNAVDLSQVGQKIEARFDVKFTAVPDVNDSDFRFAFGDRSTNQGMVMLMLDLGPANGTSGRMRYDSSLTDGSTEFVPGDYSGFMSAGGTIGDASGDTTPGPGGGLEDTVTTHSFVVTLERVERNIDSDFDLVGDMVVNGLYGAVTWTSDAPDSEPYFIDFDLTADKDFETGLGVYDDELFTERGRINQIDALGFNLFDNEPFYDPSDESRDGGYTISNFVLTYDDGKLGGDFDGDGDVDGDDYSAWADNFGVSSGASVAQGDANGDGRVDGADLLIWQGAFETPAAPAMSGVPEPSAGLLTLTACAFAQGRRRRQ